MSSPNRNGSQEGNSFPDVEKHRVMIVDDHPVTRQGLTALINQQSNLLVCGEADSMPRALELAPKLQPALAIVDISLKTSNGIELVKNLKTQMPHLSILMMSMHDEMLYAERALRAGATGYIMKHEASEHVIAAINSVLAGELYLSDRIKEKMLQRFVTDHRASSNSTFPIESLSDREMEVFQLIGNGYSTRQIATRLGLSVKTIDSYREHLKLKLGVQSGSELVRQAIQWAKTESVL